MPKSNEPKDPFIGMPYYFSKWAVTYLSNLVHYIKEIISVTLVFISIFCFFLRMSIVYLSLYVAYFFPLVFNIFTIVIANSLFDNINILILALHLQISSLTTLSCLKIFCWKLHILCLVIGIEEDMYILLLIWNK